VIDDRPRTGPPAIFCRSPTTSCLSFLLVGFHRLLLEHILQLGIAIPGVVTLRAARVILIELCIGVVDADPGEIEADLVILAVDLRKPVGGLDRVELAVDVDPFELVDQDDRRISEYAMFRSDTLDLEPLGGPVTELFHDPAGFGGAVLLHIGIIAGQGREHVRRHAPHPFRRRLHGPADVAMPLGEDVDERLAVQGQRQRPPHLGVVEGWGIAIG